MFLSQLNKDGHRAMNKTTYLKIINELKNNIDAGLQDYKDISLYVKTWVIGGLIELENKATGKPVYPYDATYKELYNDFLDAFLCNKIIEQIKEETMSYLLTSENIYLCNKLGNMINK